MVCFLHVMIILIHDLRKGNSNLNKIHGGWFPNNVWILSAGKALIDPAHYTYLSKKLIYPPNFGCYFTRFILYSARLATQIFPNLSKRAQEETWSPVTRQIMSADTLRGGGRLYGDQ